jgi:hypothetical protein
MDIDNLSAQIDLEEFKNSIGDIVKDLETNPERINTMTNEQIIEVEKYLNPYGATIYGPEKYTCISFTNLKEKYMQKLLTTALIGFTYQMASEHTVEEGDLIEQPNKNDFMEFKENPDKHNKQHVENLYDQAFNKLKAEFLENKEKNKSEEDVIETGLTEDEEIEIGVLANKEVEESLKDTEAFNNEKFLQKKEELIQEQSVEEKKIINKFLDKLFKYNPNTHSKSIFNPENASVDPERKEPVDNEFTKVIPPNDTFGRFNYYYDVNYEQLRKAVLYLYNDKPDTEVAINIFESFDSIKDCNDYIEKNQDNVITNLLNLTNYKWNLLGSFKKNRERISFYNENTIVLENILKQQEEDAKMGKILLDARVKKKKVQNIKQYGKEHPNFTKYRKSNPNDISLNSKQIEYTEDSVTITEEIEVSESGSKLDEDGTPSDCLEIGVTSINLKTNAVNTGKVFTRAVAPNVKK